MPNGNAEWAQNVRAAMGAAWRDHHHARDQTWKTLQMEVALSAGLIAVDAKVSEDAHYAVLFAGLLVVFAALSGILISFNHRKLERRKFIHIVNCEEELGLHRDDIIPLELTYKGKKGFFRKLWTKICQYIKRVVRRDDTSPLKDKDSDKKGIIEKLGIEMDEYKRRAVRTVNTNLVKSAAVSVPQTFKWFDVVNPNARNTAVFILRMHVMIMLFALLLVANRFFPSFFRL